MSFITPKAVRLFIVPFVLLASGVHVQAQDYPTKPIRFVVGFPPGGATDTAVRRLAEQVSSQIGQPIVVDNKPGASGNIAASFAAKSAPDGYTIFYGTNTTHAMNVSLYTNLGFDPVKDFSPIVLHIKVWNVLSVNAAFDVKNLKEFIAKAKVNPGSIHVATPGNATSPHMALELFKTSASIQLTHIPYKGSAPAMIDVLGNQVPAIFDNLPASLPHIKSGKFRPLAVSSPKRLAILPDVPTFDELGINGFQVAGWAAVWAPSNTPRPIIDRLNREINLALKMPKLVSMMSDMAFDLQGGTPEEVGNFAQEETAKWRTVIRAANIKLD
jgi:tripartite-type tricarboxylate transporter receptor subunit TctC